MSRYLAISFLILHKVIVPCTNQVKTQFTVIKAPVLSCAIMMMIIMIKYYAYFLVFCYSKIANTARCSVQIHASRIKLLE